MPVMQRFEFPGLFGRMAACGITRIDLADGRVLVIATELPDNPGVSVSNFAEELATIVCQRFGIDPDKLVWIEHYPPSPCAVCGGTGRSERGNLRCGTCHGTGKRREAATFDRVTFTREGDGDFIEPQWRPMQDADWRELGLVPDELFSCS